MELRLNSPVGGAPAIYYWPLNKKKGYDEAREIIETIAWGCKDIPDLAVPLKKNILKNVDVKCYESMKALTKRYNKAISNILALEKGTQKFCDRLNQVASRALLHHIIQQTYSAAVTNAEELNKYQAFSPDVYGETSFDLIVQMIDQINLTKDDVFMDLGSGVGQVVLQVAATALCKSCIGVERADVPANYAKAMESKFKFWLQWYGKRCGRFELLKGDFFDDIYREKFSEATVLFVNNFAFGPSVDHKLKQRFAELKHGTKIVSSKSFCPLNFRISDRNLSDIGTIMNITEITPSTSSVSWTDKPVTYYLQEIDRTKLENYFNAKKNGTLYSFNGEDPERSSDSFGTTDSRASSETYLGITPPPKKRGRNKFRIANDHESAPAVGPILSQALTAGPEVRKSSNITPKLNGNSIKTPNSNIIKPSKLVLNDKIENLVPPTVAKKRRGRKRKEPPNSRSRSLKLDTNNWTSEANRRTYSRKRSGSSSSSPTNHSSMPGSLKRLMDDFKMQYLQMMANMADPAYQSKIRKLIQEEVMKNVYLKIRIKEVEREIETVVSNMEKHVTCKCRR
ncbi:histone-lysine N-methyltransferase, H3 lysine-79 specific-like [Euwallacea similis]|uniref:histone-lysine N-methyltransferase, H3 lysine-79 specific-like n=1 Tax=Euwallacea similis TaxID=1736056 RepID=UPI00344CDAFF